jgi:hypothetical protein
VALRLPVAAAAALLLCGCEVYAVPNPIPCPGERQGTFDFVGDQVVTASDCFFAQPGSPAYQVNNPIAFTALVNFGPGASEAAICIQTAHAEPRLGTHAGLDVDVAYVNITGSVAGCTCPTAEAATAGRCLCPPNSLQGCSCPVVIEERIQGSLLPVPGGFSGFTGTQTVSVSPPPASPLPPQPCDCQVACTYGYDLAAKTVGTP